FSVMPMPINADCLAAPTTPSRGSYTRDRIAGSHAAASSGLARSAGTTEVVIEIGHVCAGSTWLSVHISTSRTTREPGPAGRSYGSEWTPFVTAVSISAW